MNAVSVQLQLRLTDDGCAGAGPAPEYDRLSRGSDTKISQSSVTRRPEESWSNGCFRGSVATIGQSSFGQTWPNKECPVCLVPTRKETDRFPPEADL